MGWGDQINQSLKDFHKQYANSHYYLKSINLSVYFLLLYSRRVIDGTEVIVETYGKHRSTPSGEDTTKRSPEQVPVGHRDIITDIAAFQISSASAALVTTSRDGVVKIWK